MKAPPRNKARRRGKTGKEGVAQGSGHYGYKQCPLLEQGKKAIHDASPKKRFPKNASQPSVGNLSLSIGAKPLHGNHAAVKHYCSSFRNASSEKCRRKSMALRCSASAWQKSFFVRCRSQCSASRRTQLRKKNSLLSNIQSINTINIIYIHKNMAKYISCIHRH